MNLPNKLTMFRVILIPFFVFFMLFGPLGKLGDYIALIIVSVLVSVAIEIVKKLIRFQKITTFVKDRACQILKLT